MYEDDLDGSQAEGTLTFALEGVQYEVDLSAKNAERLRKALTPYIEAGRRVGGARGRRSSKRSTGEIDPKAVRAWAESNGIEVSGRGRISAEIVEQYRTAGH
jgi:hypothetical protein